MNQLQPGKFRCWGRGGRGDGRRQLIKNPLKVTQRGVKFWGRGSCGHCATISDTKKLWNCPYRPSVMTMKLVLFLLGSLLSAIAAESIRETELMDPKAIIEDHMEASGSDDEDAYIDYYDEYSGASGDSDENDPDSTIDTPTTTLGNNVVENDHKSKIDYDVSQDNNEIEIIRKILPDDHEQSNTIYMPSTSNGFSKTEVVVAVVAGGLVGLVFAIIIVLLVMRVRKNKKGDLAYDTVKKPIYKKAPTVEA